MRAAISEVAEGTYFLVVHWFQRYHKLIYPRFAIINFILPALFEHVTHIVAKGEFLLPHKDIIAGDPTIAGRILVEANGPRYRRNHRVFQFVRVAIVQEDDQRKYPQDQRDHSNQHDQIQRAGKQSGPRSFILQRQPKDHAKPQERKAGRDEGASP